MLKSRSPFLRSITRTAAGFLLAAAPLSGALVTIPTAQATTVLKVSVPEMVKMSEWALRVRITSVTSVDTRTNSGRKTDGIFTDVAFDVLETLHGASSSAPTRIRLPGGVGRDGLALTIPGMPKFGVGEEVVVFLERSRDGHLPCGLEQGVWAVLRGPTGVPIVRQSTEGILMMAPSASGGLVAVHEDNHVRHVLLSQLAQQVRSAATILPK